MDDGRLERIERRIEELDQRESATERALETVMARSRAAMGVVVPTEARSHMRAAWRENILAVRSMLDHWAEHLNDGPKAADPAAAARDPGREKIPID